MGRKKAGKDESKLDTVHGLICTGLSRKNILDFAEGEDWTENEEEIDELIALATVRLAEAASVSLDAEMGKSIERLNKLFMESLKVQDHKTALSVQKEINRMLQLKAKQSGASRPGKLRIVG